MGKPRITTYPRKNSAALYGEKTEVGAHVHAHGLTQELLAISHRGVFHAEGLIISRRTAEKREGQGDGAREAVSGHPKNHKATFLPLADTQMEHRGGLRRCGCAAADGADKPTAQHPWHMPAGRSSAA